MKKIICANLGGPATCTEEFNASTPEEMIGKAWTHLQESHPDMAEAIKNNPKEVNDKWMADFKGKFDVLPEA